MEAAVSGSKVQGDRRLTVRGLDHVVLHVRDIERSKQFYVGLLGCTVDREHLGDVDEDAGEEEFDAPIRSFLRCGSNQIGLFQRRADVGGGIEINHLALALADGSYEDVRDVLVAAGVEVRGRAGDPRCIYISDPDGHRLQLLTIDEQH